MRTTISGGSFCEWYASLLVEAVELRRIELLTSSMPWKHEMFACVR